MNYRIVEAKDTEGLETEVNEMIQEGWTPLGGVCVVNSQANTYAWWFYQAMTREGGPQRDGD
jgi:hypothetical protein